MQNMYATIQSNDKSFLMWLMLSKSPSSQDLDKNILAYQTPEQGLLNMFW